MSHRSPLSHQRLLTTATALAAIALAYPAAGDPRPAVAAISSPATPIPAVSRVTLQDNAGRFMLSNGRIAITVRKDNAQIVSFTRTDGGKTVELGTGKLALYFDANADVDVVPAGATPVKKGYHRIDGSVTGSKVVANTPERAEIVISAAPTPLFPFQVDVYYALFAGDSGYYAYAVYRRPAGLPAATLYQTRFVAKTSVPDVFDNYVVDAERISPIPTAKVTKVLADATFQLEDGEVKTKYMQSVYWAQDLAYGTTGPNLGLWMITPSPEFFNGGPVKQGQTVHDNTVLRVMQSVHFGASPLRFADGETWQKVYGPIFVYTNSGPTTGAMLQDAEKRQQTEASRWPYAWVSDPAYDTARGAVSGRIRLTTGKSAGDAWVILSPPGSDWTAQGKGYEFWTKADAEGRFTIPKVRPGTYDLYAVGADQPEQFEKDGVTVSAGRTNDLNELDWKPVSHGMTLWQIGTFDRTAGEFRNGDDARHFQVFDRYPSQFPNDVTYTVGQSDPSRDWNYAQWTFYSKKPVWTIRFRLDKLPKGDATLTLGFASAQPVEGKRTNLLVAVNGMQVDNIHLPKTGTAGYRGGVQDSQYNVRYVAIPAADLKTGWNEITLGHQETRPFPANGQVETGAIGQGIGQVMYDAIRFEAQPE